MRNRYSRIIVEITCYSFVMEGFLNKKGRGRNVSFMRPWSMRYFVLDPENDELRYYADKKGCVMI